MADNKFFLKTNYFLFLVLFKKNSRLFYKKQKNDRKFKIFLQKKQIIFFVKIH